MPAHQVSFMNEETYESIFFHPRKKTRIPSFDYASQNYYFVTICTHNRKNMFGTPMHLNALGQVAKQCMEMIPQYYPNIMVDKFVIMPNHVHGILAIHEPKDNKIINLSKVVGQYKMAVSREFHRDRPNETLWQRSFHDHVIRNQKSYEKIWLYIEANPMKWEEDCFYSKDSIL